MSFCPLDDTVFVSVQHPAEAWGESTVMALRPADSAPT
jgi:hypothetical protein